MHPRWKPSSSFSGYSVGQKRSVSSSSSTSLGKNASAHGSTGRNSVYSTASSKKDNVSAVSSAPKGGSNGGSNDSESWILDFGTSVNVNEDIRRSIRAEIEDIDASIQQTKVGIEQEERTAAQLAKDRTHADNEMASYRRSAVELKDSASMNDQTRLDLERTLRDDVEQPLSEAPKNSSNANANANTNGSSNDKENEHGSGNGSNHDGHSKGTMTTKKFMQHTRHRAEPILRDGLCTSIAKANAECKVLEDEIASIEQRIQTENLHQLLEQKKQETQACLKDLEAEVSRKQNVQAAIQQSRMRCGGFAQDIADKRKALVDNKKDYDTKKAELRQQLEAAEADLRSIKSKEEWEAELAAVEKERDAAIKMISDAEAMIEKRKLAQTECETIQAAIQDLKVTEGEMKAKVAAIKERVGKYEEELESAKKESSQIEAMKDDNDKFLAEKALPAQSELNDVLKEKEQLAQCINEAHEALKAHSDQAAAAGQEGEKELKRLDEEVRDIEKQLDEMATEEQNLKSTKEAADEAHQKQVQQLQSSVSNLQKAAKSEQAYADERNREVKKKVELAKAAKEDAIRNRKGRERYQAVLEMGVELIKATETSIEKIQEHPLTSSDDEDSNHSNKDEYSWD